VALSKKFTDKIANSFTNWYNLYKGDKQLNRRVHNFSMSGIIGDDSQFIKMRELYERTLVQQMRDRGYVPDLDKNPNFSLVYVEKKNQYSFMLTMYGVYVGKAKSKKIEGTSNNKFLPRNSK
jgi:hypothetical protein